MERQIEYLHFGADKLNLSSKHHFYLDTYDMKISINYLFIE